MSLKTKNYELTVNELRKYKGYESITDAEALEVIRQLKELSHVLYNAFASQLKKKEIISRLKSERYED